MQSNRHRYFFLFAFFVTMFFCIPASARQGSGAEKSLQLDEVVVTADRIQAYIDKHPQQVTVMTQKQIRKGSFTDMDQVLNAMPGVEVKKSGAGLGSLISIRGSGAGGRILVLINGRPAGGTQYGSVVLDGIPLDMVTRVEVFKPPVPVWLGPGGTAGAINIVLADTPSSKRKKAKTSRIGVQGGSFGKAGINASHLMSVNEHKLHLSATANHIDGRRTNTDRNSGSVSLNWKLPQAAFTSFDVNGRYYQSEHGSAGPLYNPTPDARQSYRKASLDARAKGIFLENGDFNLKTYLDYTYLKDQSQTGAVSTLDALGYGLKSETNFSDIGDRWDLRFTAGASQDLIEHTLSGNHHREQAQLGVQMDGDHQPLSTTLGARCDYTSDFGFQPAANGGLGLALGTQTLIKINAGYQVNVPTFGQLYQPSHGAMDLIRGNPNLKEERVLSLAAGISHGFAKGRRVEFTLFHQQRDNAIGYIEDVNQIKQPVNIDRAYRQGLEVVLGWRLKENAKVDVSFIWQQTHNDENGKSLTYAPSHKFRTSLHWTWPTHTRSVLTFNARSDQFSDLDNSAAKVIKAYQSVDLKLIQPISMQFGDLKLVVLVENLFNQSFESHYGYPDDGLRFSATINLNF